jgi:hypothetical protein
MQFTEQVRDKDFIAARATIAAIEQRLGELAKGGD